ncbi:GGDEF domain-containing protein [Haliea sp. AH-315-K21]|uniref:diguanylate cyclase n=1 Tax=SAR86 cluster bacterium TaxID=2030880 RepID=A0A2A5CE61_9GAMM|nr:GGDEF domain-containing protein [Haliea sp. AH-315-K21]MBN4075510.1 GGDEF domain-containing protein [Gammaproteobacteria bacterium AH-315-E17]PCJ41818.1 MAG: GGDEF domain-containing protein [SAR86 cluster bacterium]PCJ43805.1 MAG: GGDEF domain-containing protein [SAR86 cluster bacterium]
MKKNDIQLFDDLDIDQVELKGFARSIAEIEWLLLLIVLLYYMSPDAQIASPAGLLICMELFGAFILGFHYVNFNLPHFKWKLAVETWVMILFITLAVWNTGNVDSPLLNLYLLVIISSSITLGKAITIAEIVLISAVYVLLASRSGVEYSLVEYTEFLIFFLPFMLVAYITTMLAADVNYGKKVFKVLSETDEMTGLLNKRSFSPMLHKATEVAIQYSQPLSAMMIDADNLKKVNDTYGHKAGDKLILTIASTIQDCLRTSDIICRYGGDEFVALLPQLPSDRAIETAERLRSAVENTSFDVDGQRISTTVSIGIATYPDDVLIAEELLEKADETLYESKKAGRNTVISYGKIKAESPDKDIIEQQEFGLRSSDLS